VKKSQLYIILLILALFLGAEVLSAQNPASTNTYSFEFRGETLSEALDRVTHTANIDLVYDPQLVRGFNVYQRIQNRPVPELLTQLLKEFQLDYLTLSSGTIVIVRSVAEGPFFGTLSGRITDSISGDPLPGATVYLADASGGTSTNRTGNFSLNRLRGAFRQSGSHQRFGSPMTLRMRMKSQWIKLLHFSAAM
jgi:type II secretory pathway component GspD/PulD (secretin)